jgi:hypothetical protein
MISDDYPHDFQDPSVGITFHLPSHCEFVPNAWLLHARLNRQATRIEVHYTHCLVSIEGINLGTLHERLSRLDFAPECGPAKHTKIDLGFAAPTLLRHRINVAST